jgi:hypothetical protein
MKRDMLSPAYTTRWKDIPIARIGYNFAFQREPVVLAKNDRAKPAEREAPGTARINSVTLGVKWIPHSALSTYPRVYFYKVFFNSFSLFYSF